jgi:hypothetical protein
VYIYIFEKVKTLYDYIFSESFVTRGDFEEKNTKKRKYLQMESKLSSQLRAVGLTSGHKKRKTMCLMYQLNSYV